MANMENLQEYFDKMTGVTNHGIERMDSLFRKMQFYAINTYRDDYSSAVRKRPRDHKLDAIRELLKQPVIDEDILYIDKKLSELKCDDTQEVTGNTGKALLAEIQSNTLASQNKDIKKLSALIEESFEGALKLSESVSPVLGEKTSKKKVDQNKLSNAIAKGSMKTQDKENISRDLPKMSEKMDLAKEKQVGQTNLSNTSPSEKNSNSEERMNNEQCIFLSNTDSDTINTLSHSLKKLKDKTSISNIFSKMEAVEKQNDQKILIDIASKDELKILSTGSNAQKPYSLQKCSESDENHFVSLSVQSLECNNKPEEAAKVDETNKMTVLSLTTVQGNHKEKNVQNPDDMEARVCDEEPLPNNLSEVIEKSVQETENQSVLENDNSETKNDVVTESNHEEIQNATFIMEKPVQISKEDSNAGSSTKSVHGKTEFQISPDTRTKPNDVKNAEVAPSNLRITRTKARAIAKKAAEAAKTTSDQPEIKSSSEAVTKQFPASKHPGTVEPSGKTKKTPAVVHSHKPELSVESSKKMFGKIFNTPNISNAIGSSTWSKTSSAVKSYGKFIKPTPSSLNNKQKHNVSSASSESSAMKSYLTLPLKNIVPSNIRGDIHSFLTVPQTQTSATSEQKTAVADMKIRQEQAALRKKEEMLKLAAERKQKNNERMQKAHKARVALEKEKIEAMLKQEKEKEDKRVERQMKMKEQAEQKKLIAKQKQEEAEERRRIEEMARLKKLKEEEEEQKLQQLLRKEIKDVEAQYEKHLEKEAKKEENLNVNNFKAPLLKVNNISQMKQPTSSIEVIEKKGKVIPHWAREAALKPASVEICKLPEELLVQFMGKPNKFPDVLEIFRNCGVKRLKRTSSAVWRSAPIKENA